MAKTVRMRKGDLYADICDSPETIRQAESEGYILVTEPKKETSEVKEVKGTSGRRGTGGKR